MKNQPFVLTKTEAEIEMEIGVSASVPALSIDQGKFVADLLIDCINCARGTGDYDWSEIDHGLDHVDDRLGEHLREALGYVLSIGDEHEKKLIELEQEILRLSEINRLRNKRAKLKRRIADLETNSTNS